MFDIFYFKTQPKNLPRAVKIESIEQAQEMCRTRYFWITDYLCDYSEWDFLWEPAPWESHFRHAFASQHQKDCGTYLIPKTGYTETKYNPDVIKRLTSLDNWTNANFDFDYSWHPDLDDPPYIYHFPTQHQRAGGPVYTVPGATEIKYIEDVKVNKTSVDVHWENPTGIEITEFDYTWHPDITDHPYIYQFGTQWQKTGGPRYVVPGASSVKYVDNFTVNKTTVDSCWENTEFEDFDYTWHPDDSDQPYIYQFGTQHQKTGGPRYVVPGAAETKYIKDIKVIKTSVDAHWENPDNIEFTDFDYTWHPDATDQPYIYQFGTQHQKTNGPRYVVPGATLIKYVRNVRCKKISIDKNWENSTDIKFENFDYTWHPDATDQPYIYQFGTQWQKTGGPRYVMSGATEIKYVRTVKCEKTSVDNNWDTPVGIENFDYTWHPDDTDQPYIYQFGTQWQKTGGPRYTVPGATEVKYVHRPRCEKVNVDDNWTIPDGVDFAEFDYTWHPDSTDAPYIYQFGTQWQKTGGPQYCVPGATETKYVDQIRIKAEKFANGAVVIDHFDGNTESVKEQVSNRMEIIKTARYFDNYKDTLKRVLFTLDDDQEYVWVVSSICDYKDFDFSWHPETWQSTMLHVFASNDQKFGDTFFVHVPTFLARIDDVELLEWYDCNFVEDISVSRRPLQVIKHNNDSHLDYVEHFNWKQPLTIVSNSPVKLKDIPTVNLWREKTKTIVPLTSGATNVIVPRVAVPHIKTQFYDYPHVDKTYRNCGLDKPLDIVFISNGESNAEKNWDHLQKCTQYLDNRVVRVDGIKGRAQAYRAALDASETPWAFCVFAKLEVNADFDWNWQPDRMQQSKHYIFNARNPVNGLEYGHMAMIAYNKKLVKINPATGLDFTLDQAHEVVPLLSGIARYADDPWIAWRSAFRECIKLYHSLPDIENEWRLNQWLKVNLQDDAIGDWSIRGAEDAVDYYDSVQGSFDALKLTYEWTWLVNYFTQRYNQSPDQLCTQFLNQ